MNDEGCETMRLLVQADVDNELTPADAARVAAHLDHCAACAETQSRLIALSGALRTEAQRYRAPAALQAFVRERLTEAETTHGRLDKTPNRSISLGVFKTSAAFGSGFALAACLALFLLKPVLLTPGVTPLSEAVVSAHVRALQPGHLMDVASSDRHTVKPWFDGRLPFAPPVKDLEAVGFPLVGGRLDYLAERLAAALVYTHGAHDINLFVWPDKGSVPASTATGSLNGYNYQRWTEDGMAFWAVSDLNDKDLADFVERWRALR